MREMRERILVFLWSVVFFLLVVPVYGQPTAIYLPENHDARELISDAEQLVSQGRMDAAVRLVYGLLSDHSATLVEVEDGLLRRVPDVVWSGVGSSEVFERAYRRQYGDRARGALALIRRGLGQRRDLERFHGLYWPTEAGAEAGLRLFGLHMEAGRLDEAERVVSMLEGRRVAPVDGARLGAMRELVSVYRGVEPGALAASWSQGSELSGAGGSWGPSPAAIGPRDAVPLWTMGWGEISGVLSLSEEDPGLNPAVQQMMRRQAAALVSQPVLEGDAVLLNLGREVVSLDRYSGLVRWRVGAPEVEEEVEHDEAMTPLLMQRRLLAAMVRRGERQGLSVSGGRAYAVMSAARGSGGGGSMVQHLVCLDASGGGVVWSVSPGDLATSSEQDAFSGEPLVLGDRVYVQLVRTQAGALSELEVVCFDADDGAELWRQFVGTVGAGRVAVGMRTASLGTSWEGDRLVLFHPAGLVAVLDPDDGVLSWVTSLPGRLDGVEVAAAENAGRPVSQVAALEHRSAEVWSALPGGVLVQPFLAGPGYLLRLEDGHLLGSTGGELRGLRELVRVGVEEVLAVGDELVVYGPSLAIRDQIRVDGVGDPVGAASGLGLWVRHGGSLLWVDPEGGVTEVWGSVSDEALYGANHEQVVLADTDGVSAYMSWPLARARLSAAVEEAGDDPSQGIRLAEVAMGQRDRSTVLSGLGASWSLMQRPGWEAVPSERGGWFDRLVVLSQGNRWTGGRSSELMVSMLDRLSSTSSERAMVLLLRARSRVGSGDLAGAVEAYQSILLDEAMSRALLGWLGAGSGLPAGQTVRGELRELVSDHGQSVYRSFDARALLEMRAAQERRDAEALSRVSRRYPASVWVRPALELAGRVALSQGRALEATLYLRQAYRLADRGEDAFGVLRLLHEAYGMLGSPQRQSMWVKRFVAAYPELRGRVEGLGWLTDAPSVDALPGWGRLSGRAWPVSGVMEAPLAGSDVVLSRDAQRLSLWRQREGDAPELVRRVGFEGRIMVVGGDERDVLVTLMNPSQVVCLDRETGEERWRRDDLFTGEGQGEVRREGEEQLRALGIHAQALGGIRRLDVVRSRLVNGLVSDFRVVVMDQMGRLVGLDRATGQTVWRQSVSLSGVTSVALNEWVVVLLGQRREPGQPVRTVVVMVDTLTGELLHEPIEAEQPIFSVCLDGSDRMMTLQQRGVVCYDLLTGEERWAHRAADGVVFQRPFWNAGGFLAIRDQRGVLHVVETDGGELVLRERSRLAPRASVSPIREADGVLYVAWGMTLAAVDHEGDVLWRAVAGGPNQQIQGHWLTGDRVVVAVTEALAVGGESETYLEMYERSTGRLVSRRRLDGLDQMSDFSRSGVSASGMVVNRRNTGGVLLGTESEALEAEPDGETETERESASSSDQTVLRR